MSTENVYFETLPEDVKKKAFENLAYELLDSYLDNHREDEDIEERLMETLESEKFYYKYWAEYNDLKTGALQ
jgi:hypothetical protein